MRQFSGEPHTRWLTQSGRDRDMLLLDDFWFVDGNNKRWDAPKKSRIDGASIPRPLWALVGSPYTGDYRRASIVHDVACKAAVGNEAARRAADRMFFEACREGGCTWWDATVLYVGVRIGAWWGQTALAEDAIRLSDEPGEVQLRQEFRHVSENVLREGETDNPDVIEARTDVALARYSAQAAAASTMWISQPS